MAFFSIDGVLLHLPTFLQAARRQDFSWSTLTLLLFFGVLAFIVWRIIALSNRSSPPSAHWHHHFENVNYSPQQFYKTIAQLVKEKELPNVSITTVTYSEAGIFSMKRDYLRITRDRLVFDICAAPFAKGFFVSWWQIKLPSQREVLISLIPFLGRTILRDERGKTYFEIDTETMYKDSIHQSVLQAIDAITTEKGLRALAHHERNQLVESIV